MIHFRIYLKTYFLWVRNIYLWNVLVSLAALANCQGLGAL